MASFSFLLSSQKQKPSSVMRIIRVKSLSSFENNPEFCKSMDLNSCLIQTRNRRYFALLVLKANLAELLLCARYADCNVFRDYCSLHSCFIYYTQLHNRSTAAVPLVPVKLRSLALQEQTHYKVQNSANYPVLDLRIWLYFQLCLHLLEICVSMQ